MGRGGSCSQPGGGAARTQASGSTMVLVAGAAQQGVGALGQVPPRWRERGGHCFCCSASLRAASWSSCVSTSSAGSCT